MRTPLPTSGLTTQQNAAMAVDFLLLVMTAALAQAAHFHVASLTGAVSAATSFRLVDPWRMTQKPQQTSMRDVLKIVQRSVVTAGKRRRVLGQHLLLEQAQ